MALNMLGQLAESGVNYPHGHLSNFFRILQKISIECNTEVRIIQHLNNLSAKIKKKNYIRKFGRQSGLLYIIESGVDGKCLTRDKEAYDAVGGDYQTVISDDYVNVESCGDIELLHHYMGVTPYKREKICSYYHPISVQAVDEKFVDNFFSDELGYVNPSLNYIYNVSTNADLGGCILLFVPVPNKELLDIYAEWINKIFTFPLLHINLYPIFEVMTRSQKKQFHKCYYNTFKYN